MKERVRGEHKEKRKRERKGRRGLKGRGEEREERRLNGWRRGKDIERKK